VVWIFLSSPPQSEFFSSLLGEPGVESRESDLAMKFKTGHPKFETR